MKNININSILIITCMFAGLTMVAEPAIAGGNKKPKSNPAEQTSVNASMKPFIFTVNLVEPGTVNIPLVSKKDYDIKLPAKEEKSYKISYDLDCDADGVYEKVNQTGNIKCQLDAGDHRISVRGMIPGVKFDTGKLVNGRWYTDEDGLYFDKDAGGFDLKKPLNVRIISIDQWGDTAWRNLSKMFECGPADIMGLNYCENPKSGCGHKGSHKGFDRTYKAKDAPNLKYVRSLSCVGGAYSKYEGDFSHWDVSEITDMSRAFMGVPEKISLELCMSCNFVIDEFNQDIGAWNTSNVTNMSSMFEGNYSFNQNISGWNTAKVTNMSHMFQHASIFNQDISRWNTSNVKDMSWMFHKAWEFNQPIGSWDTSNVTNMNSMFAESSFNQDISNWDTSNVKDMGYMFYEGEMNQPLGQWNILKVKDMSNMFYGCRKLDQNFSKWDVSKIRTKDMFESTDMKEENYPRGMKLK